MLSPKRQGRGDSGFVDAASSRLKRCAYSASPISPENNSHSPENNSNGYGKFSQTVRGCSMWLDVVQHAKKRRLERDWLGDWSGSRQNWENLIFFLAVLAVISTVFAVSVWITIL
jgi:hypothetical protein